MPMSTAGHITDVDNKYKIKWNTANVLDFWQFWCSNDGIILLNKLASFGLVVVSASMCFGVAMQRAEIVSTSASITTAL